MSTLEALNYIMADPNGKLTTCNEWVEAALWHLTCKILAEPDRVWNNLELDLLLEQSND